MSKLNKNILFKIGEKVIFDFELLAQVMVYNKVEKTNNILVVPKRLKKKSISIIDVIFII